MATKRCCSGCSGSNNCYGALNCVPSPYGYNCRNYPYYTGPCAPICGDDRCRPRPPWDCDRFPAPPPPPNPPAQDTANASQAYGFFTATPPLTISAGGVIPLSTALANAADFTNSSGSILIRRAGVYLLSYTVQVGTNNSQNTQYYLTLNGTTVNASSVSVVTDDSATETRSFTVQVIVQAGANSMLTLNSSSALSVADSALNPYSLTVVRLA